MRHYTETALPLIATQVDQLFSTRVMNKYNWTFGSKGRVKLEHKKEQQASAEPIQIVVAPTYHIKQVNQPLYLSIAMKQYSFSQIPAYKQQLLIEQGDTISRESMINRLTVLNNEVSQLESKRELLIVEQAKMIQHINDAKDALSIVSEKQRLEHTKLEQNIHHYETLKQQATKHTLVLEQLSKTFKQDKLVEQLKRYYERHISTLDSNLHTISLIQTNIASQGLPNLNSAEATQMNNRVEIFENIQNLTQINPTTLEHRIEIDKQENTILINHEHRLASPAHEQRSLVNIKRLEQHKRLSLTHQQINVIEASVIQHRLQTIQQATRIVEPSKLQRKTENKQENTVTSYEQLSPASPAHEQRSLVNIQRLEQHKRLSLTHQQINVIEASVMQHRLQTNQEATRLVEQSKRDSKQENTVTNHEQPSPVTPAYEQPRLVSIQRLEQYKRLSLTHQQINMIQANISQNRLQTNQQTARLVEQGRQDSKTESEAEIIVTNNEERSLASSTHEQRSLVNIQKLEQHKRILLTNRQLTDLKFNSLEKKNVTLVVKATQHISQSLLHNGTVNNTIDYKQTEQLSHAHPPLATEETGKRKRTRTKKQVDDSVANSVFASEELTGETTKINVVTHPNMNKTIKFSYAVHRDVKQIQQLQNRLVEVKESELLASTIDHVNQKLVALEHVSKQVEHESIQQNSVIESQQTTQLLTAKLIHTVNREQTELTTIFQQEHTDIKKSNQTVLQRDIRIEQKKLHELINKKRVIHHTIVQAQKRLLEPVTSTNVIRRMKVSSILGERQHIAREQTITLDAQQQLHYSIIEQDRASTPTFTRVEPSQKPPVKLHVKQEGTTNPLQSNMQVEQLRQQVSEIENKLEKQYDALKQSYERVSIKQLTTQVYDELTKRLKFERQRLGR